MARSNSAELPSGRAPDLISESLRSPGATVALLELWLDRFLPPADTVLHRAMRYAVFSGGRRLRPQFLLQAAQACGAEPLELELALRAACAIELVHTASLVHDDLPCFDDATERRGQPTVHVRFGEPMALLVGDALLTQGFELLVDTPKQLVPRALRLIRLLSRAASSSAGLIGGQSLEQEAVQDESGAAVATSEFIDRYHGMKTGVLFAKAAEMAALTTKSPSTAAWVGVGQLFGKWYQLAHDLTEVSAPRGVEDRVEPGTMPGLLGAVLSRGEQAVRAQLDGLLALIRTRVMQLAIAPESMLAFLDALQAALLARIAADRKGQAPS